MEFSIRLAEPSDAPWIRDLCQASNVPRDSTSACGLVEFPIPTIEQYVDQLTDNPFFYIAQHNARDVGFSVNHPDHRLDAFHDPSDLIMRFLAEQERPFIYADHTCIEPTYHHTGLGSLFIERLIHDAKESGYPRLWAAISHHPFENKASKGLAFKNGFACVDEVILDGMTFGMYTLDITNRA